ncbi:unnamed protein product (macronuclear) [Paramecium tetraurelia]|uniref:Uncharacterized protein n=1 Tax=Paramecium tetraurelia TaxID=5888 RepID=A0EAJ0_PARTE|nr:uncharacterized protein GSPATT00025040001 [Paramecium tetraurelia]CAK92307.1 unnamed protein product [Paramecium tetraurelia]|eukprot:XP_001459704.1 hypothetical protein (macronuclear) [Paramecium tetraurelia strain d4-2]
MKQVSSTTDYSILRQIQIHHSHTQPKESDITLGRTTSYESSQFCRNFNIMAFRRASTKEDINSAMQGKNQAYAQETIAISNLNFIKQSQFHLHLSPSSQIEMNQLQTKVWKSLQKQMLQKVYSIDIIVLLQNQNEYEFKFDISKLSCFLMVKELSNLISQAYWDRINKTNQKRKFLHPYLSILVGRVKTQKLDGNMRLFELIHILLNGQKTLILQESPQPL